MGLAIIEDEKSLKKMGLKKTNIGCRKREWIYQGG